jgi:hypothetical protein
VVERAAIDRELLAACGGTFDADIAARVLIFSFKT